MDFAAFVLLNAIYYIRPMEFVPSLYAWPLYNIAFWICFALNLPNLFDLASVRSILGSPIGVCVLTVAASCVASNVVRGQFDDAATAAFELIKVVLYYLMLLATVNTPLRLKWFLASLVIDGSVMSALGVGDYLGYFEVPNLTMTVEPQYLNGEMVPLRRLGSTGMFGDPNDFGQLIVGCILYSLYLIVSRSTPLPLRVLWLLPVAILLKALLLTYSRAGMLSLLTGLAIYAVCRFGRRILIVVLLVAPVVLSVGGRQLDFSLSEGTGQSRVELWLHFLDLFIHNPFFGIGYGHALDYSSLVAHNSYIHAFAELGFAGGSAFLCAMILSLSTLIRLGCRSTPTIDTELRSVWPFLLAVVACYAIGIMSLSRCYAMPTYTVFGLAANYERISLAGTKGEPLKLGSRSIALLPAVSFSFVVGMYFAAKFLVRY